MKAHKIFQTAEMEYIVITFIEVDVDTFIEELEFKTQVVTKDSLEIPVKITEAGVNIWRTVSKFLIVHSSIMMRIFRSFQQTIHQY